MPPTQPIVIQLAQAIAAQVRVGRTRDGRLDIQAPASAADIAKQIRTRDADILRLFDWTRTHVADPAPCLLCGTAAILRNPADARPCHKVCVDQLLGARR